METKTCGKCGQEKPIEEFFLRVDKRDGKVVTKAYRISRCNSCIREYRRQWNRARRTVDPTYWARRGLFRRYGITGDEKEWLAQRQSGVCPLCQRETKLVVDHDHISGEVRGLLCGNCNYMLGFLEQEAWVQRAREYLTHAPLRTRRLLQQRRLGGDGAAAP